MPGRPVTLKNIAALWLNTPRLTVQQSICKIDQASRCEAHRKERHAFSCNQGFYELSVWCTGSEGKEPVRLESIGLVAVT